MVPSRVVDAQRDAQHDVLLDDRCDDLRDGQHDDVDARYGGQDDDADSEQLRNLQPNKQKIKYF